tara:strand:+ start:36789 stop:37001 length:213 start_codon:yes stop_codon:yes gene_type:complete
VLPHSFHYFGIILSLGSCPVYFAYPYIQRAKKALGIEKYRRVYLGISFGYADENPDRPARHHVDEVTNNI